MIPAVIAAVISSLLVVGRGPIVGRALTLASVNPAGSLEATPARLAGLTYLAVSAPAIWAAYEPVNVSIDAAAGAASNPTRAARLVRAEVLPRLRRVQRLAESISPLPRQIAEIHFACLAALRDAVARYSLLAGALQTGNSSAFSKAEVMSREAIAEWTRWKVGLIELVLGEGLPLKPSNFGLNAG